jgi:hypothetical protein
MANPINDLIDQADESISRMELWLEHEDPAFLAEPRNTAIINQKFYETHQMIQHAMLGIADRPLFQEYHDHANSRLAGRVLIREAQHLQEEVDSLSQRMSALFFEFHRLKEAHNPNWQFNFDPVFHPAPSYLQGLQTWTQDTYRSVVNDAVAIATPVVKTTQFALRHKTTIAATSAVIGLTTAGAYLTLQAKEKLTSEHFCAVDDRPWVENQTCTEASKAVSWILTSAGTLACAPPAIVAAKAIRDAAAFAQQHPLQAAQNTGRAFLWDIPRGTLSAAGSLLSTVGRSGFACFQSVKTYAKDSHIIGPVAAAATYGVGYATGMAVPGAFTILGAHILLKMGHWALSPAPVPPRTLE